MSTHDSAASYRRYTPRQAAQAGARHDREAREVIAAHKAQVKAEAIEAAIRRAIIRIERLGVVALTGTVRGDAGLRPVTREELLVCKDSVKDGWSTLRRYGAGRVTVLA